LSSSSSPYLQAAVSIVRRAGAMQLEHFGGRLTIAKKGTIDLVTNVDLAVERMGREEIARAFPDHQVLGEEYGVEGTGAAGHVWIFDPIDGTTNFAHGLPIFCTSLALEIDGRLEVGTVYDPTRDELFTAERGRGAWLNGTRLQVSSHAALIDSLLVTGFPYTVHTEREALLALFDAFMGRSRAVRRLGSAALDVCDVAAGRMDGFWEQGLGPWDIAAAALLVEEAGGRISDLDGRPFTVRTGRLVASNGHIHDQMLETIAAWRADRARKRTD
jgi:myo-inositol-1(or 4)-monophosphatase